MDQMIKTKEVILSYKDDRIIYLEMREILE